MGSCPLSSPSLFGSCRCSPWQSTPTEANPSQLLPSGRGGAMEGSVESPVAEFYRDKTVSITGATGFMGKVLVEKLLRSTSVARIYLLIRPKKGVLTQQRLAVLLGTKIFDRVRKEKEEALSRVVAVSGDITEDRLGLSEEEENVLAETVNIVFHCAATVRFDEDLTKSIGMNVSGVLAVVALAKKMARLEALVDVSTAYCNCDIPHIEERVYPAPGDPHGMIDMCTWMDPSLLDAPDITKKMIGNRPNTYTFTKALAESLLSTEATELPVAIMRPRIVSASLNEPYPGWVDNFNGPSGIIAAAGKGIMRTLHSRGTASPTWFQWTSASTCSSASPGRPPRRRGRLLSRFTIAPVE